MTNPVVLNLIKALADFAQYKGYKRGWVNFKLREFGLSGHFSKEDITNAFNGENPPLSIKKTQGFDPYEILGVTRNSDANTIKSAYKLQLKWYHPDRINFMGPDLIEYATERTKLINQAYEMLINKR